MPIITIQPSTTAARVDLPRAAITAAGSHAKKAIKVLLSVRSCPSGHPVQNAPKANFWTMGPSTNPPTMSNAIEDRTSPRALGRSGRRTSKRALVDSNMDMNMARMCGISTPAGTSPL